MAVHCFRRCASLGRLNALKNVGLETIAMTTNGITLKKNLAALVDAGLDMLNISLDTLVASKFECITRRSGWDRVMQAIDAALEIGYRTLKVNCRKSLEAACRVERRLFMCHCLVCACVLYYCNMLR